MTALWVAVALVVAGFAGWPVTALVFKLARTIDDKADAAKAAEEARRTEQDPSADVTVDDPSPIASRGEPGRATSPDAVTAPDGPVDAAGRPAGQAVDGELTAPAAGPASGGPAAGPALPSQRILRGGAIIGVLERLGVCLAILTGQPVAIAYIVAIKGLGRFAELKETPVAAERFIIGTLTSMLWAAGTAAAVKVLFLQ
ncbi:MULTISPECIES: hypothetical protein [Micrococcaceae]|uniref:hypothetical protein n=1 Tax=Micrococcaceae TaxID=1268 RepID=UPI0006F5A10C|nr:MULTISPECIES: hypothetical protein [unclassified Arthrobacter]KRE74008.1 hypothetical protein ASG79_21260 [Arthrobacter sp. Soil761]BCW54036.1 hypothetical protein StoSoilB19_14100 [Arthrobacter sp. StoSoilB19]